MTEQLTALEWAALADEAVRSAVAADKASDESTLRPYTPRACFYCGKALSVHRGFIETVSQPDGERRDFCSRECLHWQLHEDEKL